MSTYYPDRWVIIEIDYNGDVIRKVLAGWYGGFASGDSWKLSSGITDIKLEGDVYAFTNESGSIYYCHKNNNSMSSYMMQQYAYFQDNIPETVKMRIVEDFYETK